MKVLAKQPLFQYGVSAYKGQEVEVDEKSAKMLIEKGFAEAVKVADTKPEKAKK
jgi:hypothetical protein